MDNNCGQKSLSEISLRSPLNNFFRNTNIKAYQNQPYLQKRINYSVKNITHLEKTHTKSFLDSFSFHNSQSFLKNNNKNFKQNYNINLIKSSSSCNNTPKYKQRKFETSNPNSYLSTHLSLYDSERKCSHSCKVNILKKYRYLRFLNTSELDNLIFNNFRKIPNQYIQQVLKKRSIKANSNSCKIKYSCNKKKYKEQKNDQFFINSQNPKIFLANANKAKQNNYINLISSFSNSQLSKEESTSSKSDINTKKDSDSRDSEHKHIGLKKFSLVDKFLLKLIDPDELLEDYIIAPDKTFDRYTKLKKTCLKEKSKINRILFDLHKAPSVSKDLLKRCMAKIK